MVNNKRKQRNTIATPEIKFYPLKYQNEADIVDIRVDVKFQVSFMSLEKAVCFPKPNNSLRENEREFSQPLMAAKDSPISTLLTVMQGKGIVYIHCVERNGKKHVFTKGYDISDTKRMPLKVNNAEKEIHFCESEDELICNNHISDGWFEIEIECIKDKILTFKSDKKFLIINNLDDTPEEISCTQEYLPVSNKIKLYIRPSVIWQEISVTDERTTVNIIFIKESKS